MEPDEVEVATNTRTSEIGVEAPPEEPQPLAPSLRQAAPREPVVHPVRFA